MFDDLRCFIVIVRVTSGIGWFDSKLYIGDAFCLIETFDLLNIINYRENLSHRGNSIVIDCSIYICSTGILRDCYTSFSTHQ